MNSTEQVPWKPRRAGRSFDRLLPKPPRATNGAFGARSSTIGFVTAIILMSLWDIYIPDYGGRPFDFIALGLTAALILASFGSLRARLGRISPFHVVYLLAALPGVGLALAEGYWLTAVAFMVGAVFIYPVYSTALVDQDALARIMSRLIVFNLAIFVVQYISFSVTGSVIDIHSPLGIEARIYNEALNYFRPSGLYMEPNSFCVTMFMMMLLRNMAGQRSLDALTIATVICMLLSRSLWGFAGALLLALSAVRNWRVLAVGALATIPVVAAVALGGRGIVLAVTGLVLDPVTQNRLNNILDDSSAQGRFSGSGDIDSSIWEIIFGHGLSTSDFQVFAGANGWSFYIYSFGLLGMLLLLAWIALEGGPTRMLLIKAGAVLFVMTTYPLFTTLWWWLWLALFLKAGPGFGQRKPAPARRVEPWSARRQAVILPTGRPGRTAALRR